MAAKGHRCNTCTWTLRPGTDVDQHNSRLLHLTLLDASARLTPKEFQRFRDRVVLNGDKRRRIRLKQELKAAPQGQVPLPGALALREEPRPLATRDRDALKAINGLCDHIVTVEKPCDWNIELHSTKRWGLDESVWIIRHFRNEGHSVPDSVWQVIGLDYATSHKGQNKGVYLNLHDFRELREDCMLIHHGEMVAILLHGFVASTKASKHV